MPARTGALLTGLVLLFALSPVRAAAQDAAQLYVEACDAGDMIACNVFGLMLETGEGVPQDLPRAADFYQQACQGGELVGCTNAGLLHLTGSGVDPDAARAAGLFRVACEGGELLGCNLLRDLEDAASDEPTERYDKVGRVGDAETGEPLSEVLLEVVGTGMQSVSEPSGEVTFRGLAEGTHRVRAQKLGYRDIEGVFEVPGDPRFFVLMTPADVADPNEPGRIVGRVSDGFSGWLANVEITVLDQPSAGVISNRDGRFTVREVEPGLVDVRFARLGYAPRSVTLVVQPGRTVEVAATMFVEPIELEPIQVTVRSSFLEQSGFYARAGRGVGTHFTAFDIERLVPQTLADVLQGRVPGLRIQYGAYQTVLTNDTTPTTGPASSSVARAVSSRSNCPLTVYVDGRREMLEVDLNYWTPQDLEAIEVYTGVDTPAQYAGNLCGVILLWTRRGA